MFFEAQLYIMYYSVQQVHSCIGHSRQHYYTLKSRPVLNIHFRESDILSLDGQVNHSLKRAKDATQTCLCLFICRKCSMCPNIFISRFLSLDESNFSSSHLCCNEVASKKRSSEETQQKRQQKGTKELYYEKYELLCFC